ncbi:hypothetical protein Tco_0077354 [Tanacetum coccineum]
MLSANTLDTRISASSDFSSIFQNKPMDTFVVFRLDMMASRKHGHVFTSASFKAGLVRCKEGKKWDWFDLQECEIGLSYKVQLRGEEERNDNDDIAADGGINETDMEMPVKEAEKETEAEKGTKNKQIKRAEREETEEASSSQSVGNSQRRVDITSSTANWRGDKGFQPSKNST